MSDRLDRALSAAEKRTSELLPVLERWVRQNSYSRNVEGVNLVADLLAEDFDIDGLSVERVDGSSVGDHLMWTTPAWDDQPSDRILLVGHHDTVFPPDSFEVWDHEKDRVRGPGVLDMKGGLVTIQSALAALSEAELLADLPLAVVSVGDEEIGSPHSRSVLEKFAAGASCALVFEAGRSEDKIITRRKGTGALEVTVKGVAAHAGNHHKQGVNAIWALARFIDAVQQLTDYDKGITVNVGLIEGGDARNTVPAMASCGVDFRFISAEDGEHLVHDVGRLAAATADVSDAKITVAGGIRRLPLERTEASAAVCSRYAAAAKASGLGSEEADLIGGGSDASTVSAVGVPAIDGLGPRGSGFHTHDEFIEVSSLSLRVQALIRFLLSS